MSYLTVACVLAAALAVVLVLNRLRLRLQLSFAKHRSLTGHGRMARRVAALVPFYEYGEDRFFCADEAPQDVEPPGASLSCAWRTNSSVASPSRRPAPVSWRGRSPTW